MKKNEKIRLTTICYGNSFLVGAFAILLGSTLNDLVDLYQKPLESVVLLGSAYAVGRVISSYVIGKISNKFKPLDILLTCNILSALYLLLLPLIPQLQAGILLSFIGGLGFAGNDATCPTLLSYVFKEKYSASLSISQCIYGCGGFAISLLAGLIIDFSWTYRVIYYVLFAIVVLMIILALSCKKIKYHDDQQEDLIKPLYTKNRRGAFAALIIASFGFCAVCNMIGTYTISYGQALGYNEDIAAYLLTTYNIGLVVGALAFTPILNHVQEKTVLLINTIVTLVALVSAFLINNIIVYFIGLFIAGFFWGIVFSVIIAITTRIGYKNMTYYSSLIGTFGGIGDISIPMVTSVLLTNIGIVYTYQIIGVIIMIVIICSVIINRLVEDKNNG